MMERKEKSYAVRYYDNMYDGEDCVCEYASETEAEAAIEHELCLVKQMWASRGYDYADFGRATEIWIPGDCEYCRWERLW